MRAKLKNGIALSFILQIILVKWFGSYPHLVEKYYSEGMYPVISRFLRILNGWVPFSVGDILYATAGFLAIRYLYKNWRKIRKKPLLFLRDLVMVFSLVYFVFHLFWGLNYYRLPIQEKMGFTATYSKEELISFSAKLIKKTNSIHLALGHEADQPIKIPYDTKTVYAKTIKGYDLAASFVPELTYKNPSLKSSLFSLPLTYMGYGGYLNPFTNEAQVNSVVPILRLPTISGHEVGHQIGYSSESATNFIGFLITANNEDPYFSYAARSHALAYCLSELRKVDKDAFELLYADVNNGIKKNYQELEQFWANYENPTEPIFKSIFNTFLKANNQTEGIQSYNRVVGLLIGYDRTYGF
jgi:hypothetical protein